MLILDQFEENEGGKKSIVLSVHFHPSPLLWSHIFLTKVHFTGSGRILLFGKWSNYFWKMRKARKNLAEASSAMLNHYSHQWEFSFQRLKGTAQSNSENFEGELAGHALVSMSL